MSSRRKSKSTEPMTAAQVKALADQLSQQEQFELHQLFVLDSASWVGKLVRTHLQAIHNERMILERLLGIAPSPIAMDPPALVIPGEIDPERLLSTEETDKQARRRTKRKSTDAVKTARSKLRRKIEKVAVPPRSLPLR